MRGRAAQRCAVVRGISIPVQRGREPSAPLDSRGLADCPLAAAGVPGLDGSRRKNPLSGVSRWKIFDNLRRSLVSAALTLLLVLGWTVLSPPWLWTLAVIGTILIPPGMASFLDLFQKPGDVRVRQHLAVTVRSAGQHFAQAAFTLTCLPYEAFFSLDAIVRTAWRLWVHPQTTSGVEPVERRGSPKPHGPCRLLGDDVDRPAVAIAAAIYLILSRPAALAVAAPLLVLWLASPAIAWWISRPLARHAARLTADQTLFLRKLSRKTWAFFETFSARKIIGCRRITIKSIPLPWSRIARRRPTWDWHSLRICPLTTSATLRPGSSSGARPRPSAPWKPWNATKATSTTGTTRSL